MNNLHGYDNFKSLKNTDSEESLLEGAQLFDTNWKVRSRVEIPVALINAYVKKVEAETGEKLRQKWSEQELAEELAKYVSTAFLSVENLPSTIVTSTSAQPTVQTEEDMPIQTQVQDELQDEDIQDELQSQPVQGGQVQGGQVQGGQVQGGQVQGQPGAQGTAQNIQQQEDGSI